MEFDHIFITVKSLKEIKIACEILLKAGFVQGTDNFHVGQGTANKRFFFQNAFIELLYPNPKLSTVKEVKDELLSAVTQSTRLYERIFEIDNASPFGICLRSKYTMSKSESIKLPFATWQYRPDYLPKNLSISISEASLHEPMWFYLNFASRPDSYVDDKRQPLDHNNNCEIITHVAINLNDINDSSNMLSLAANYIDSLDDVSVRVADKSQRENQMNHQTIITIDHGAQSKEIKLLGNKLILRY